MRNETNTTGRDKRRYIGEWAEEPTRCCEGGMPDMYDRYEWLHAPLRHRVLCDVVMYVTAGQLLSWLRNGQLLTEPHNNQQGSQ